MTDLTARIAKLEALADKLAEALGEAVTWDGVDAVWLSQADKALAAHTLHKIDG